MEKTELYWYPKEILTYNRLFNFILGNRTAGKTYGCKELAIDDFINDEKMIEVNGKKHRQQFAYVRRYKDDLKDSLSTFFDDIYTKYPNHEFKVEGNKLYCRLATDPEEKVKWTRDDIIGYGFTLSTASNKKSIAYPYITKLIYDECLLDKGKQQYLEKEPDKLFALYETIARPGTDHVRVICFMLANAMTTNNPYFLEWDLCTPTKKAKNGRWIWTHPTRPILVEDVKNENLIEKKEQSEFGAMVKGTKYGEHSIHNTYYLDDDTFIEKRSPNARYYFTFKYKEHTFGVWVDFNEGKMWVSKSIDPSYLFVYALTMKDHRPNTLLITTKAKKGHLKAFTDAYKIGSLYFENQTIKNLTCEVLKMLN